MRRTLMIALVLVAAVLIACPAMAGRVKHPSELEFPDLTVEPLDYEELTFENGMTGFFVEDHEVPVVDIYMLIPVSAPPREKTGLAGLTSWAVRNGGSENWPAERINEELEFVAASVEFGGGGGGMFGGGRSVSSSRAVTVRVNYLKKDLDLCLEILGDLLAHPVFPEEQIELRKSTMLEDIRRENDDPRGIANRELRKILYGDHPMAWRSTVETVEGLTRDDVAWFYGQYYHPNTAIIGISGDVTQDEITAKLDAALAGWQPANVVLEPEPEIELTYEPGVYYVEKELNQGVILIGHLGMNSLDENRIPVSIMNFVLGGGSFTSRITQKVRTDEGLAYSAYSQYGHDAFGYGLFRASSQTKAEATGRATTLIIDLIRQMQEEGPTQDEFDRAVDSSINNRVFENDSKAGVVTRLVTYKFQGRPLDTSERDLETLTNLTLEDVKAAAAEYLHPDGLVILVVGDEELFDQPMSHFGEVQVIELD